MNPSFNETQVNSQILLSNALPTTPAFGRERSYFNSRELNVVDSRSGHGFALKFNQLASRNGFQRTAETLAVFFQRRSSKEVSKLALKQAREMSALKLDTDSDAGAVVRMGNSVLSRTESSGSIIATGKTLEWDLRMRPLSEASFNSFPRSLRRLGLFRNIAITEEEDLLATGWISTDGTRVELLNAHATLRACHGPKLLHSWAWGQCSSFVTDNGKLSDFIFEATSGRGRLLGAMPGPRFSSFYFRYRGQPYAFNSAWSSVRLVSKSSLTHWTFRADRGDLSFRGELSAEHRDFAGLTSEDTDGSLAYSALSLVSDAKIHVYRRGKLEASLSSNGGAAFELISRKKNDYISLLV